ncbi:1-deoxy-D-xylulose-5-phosphate reductoisomerase [Atopobium fossor]|uniref:1-deoxy-D-xylulose-5-phosphate reductoisomerase n=1 Tax=Atopobium fossor TaxID=39487 RepID=UPI0003F92493|nr:1-deoxy-D-xylulose-5-phosphate reductoisomerase [Atopobium fossor]
MSIFEATWPEANRPEVLRVAILGATGSIGTQALDVCRKHSNRLQVVALSAHSSVEKLCALAHEFKVKHLALSNEDYRSAAAIAQLDAGVQLGFGNQAVAELAALEEVDLVLVSVVGAAGILPSYTALINNKILALANKEALVCAGDLLMPLVKPGKLIPVDSEHSAIFQCMMGTHPQYVSRIWLTCSGGPFYGKTVDELYEVTSAQALKHPNWHMGPKITIDSATLMNKGLEVLEAHHLFNVTIDDIQVLIQRQSRIHSMIETTDGSVMAQLGPSDMRGPIQLAFSYPERWEAPTDPVNFFELGSLDFAPADDKTFKCLALAREAGRIGKTMPCALNAANEVANLAFRQGSLSFLQIAHVVEKVMELTTVQELQSLTQLVEVDKRARALTKQCIDEVI